MSLLVLLNAVQSPDNNQRKLAEEQLGVAVAADPSSSALELINIAKAHGDLALRQFALLYLKKIVPMYWSAGFESFKGPAISQEHKAAIRNSLLEVVTNDPHSKIRNGASYAVVQIAVVDYPDEWPSLLETLYNHMISLNRIAVLGGLSLLQDLLDDLVTEEQFFNGVGIAIISQCMKLMGNSTVDAEVKTAAANLYKSCLLQLENPAYLEDESKRPALQQHFNEIVTMMTVLLQDTTLDIHCMLFRTALYAIAYVLATEFPEELFEPNAKLALQKETINDVSQLAGLFATVVIQEDDEFPNDTEFDTVTVLTNLVIEQFQFLGGLEDLGLFSVLTSDNFLNAIITVASLPLETESEYSEEYDTFVTEETGVSPDFSARNAVFQYMSELNAEDVSKVFNGLIDQLQYDQPWKTTEAVLYLLCGLFDHQEPIASQSSLVDSLNKFLQFTESPNTLLRARAVITVPLFLDKFQDRLSDDFATKSLLHCIRLANNDSTELFKSAFLVALLSYRELVEFHNLGNEIQNVLFDIIASLISSAKDDTPPLLAEALVIALKINNVSMAALNLMFEIAQKDAGNIELVLDIEDVLETLLESIDMTTFTGYIQNVLSRFIPVIVNSKGDFSAELMLALQVLSIFLESCPGEIPEDVFAAVDPVIYDLLMVTSDDQVLQAGGELYNSLIKNSDANLFDIQKVLQVLSKFLNPELSDSAALNVGTLSVSVITKFSSNLETFLPEILKATTQRLLQARELATIQDLLNVLCYMISIDVTQSVQFLANFEIQKIFNIWFSNFSSVSGTSEIKHNCQALVALFLSGIDFDFTVDGDEMVDLANPNLIITRSMRKNAEYKQILVPVKIIKLLVHELRDQSTNHQYESRDGDIDAVADDDEEGWEDFDDIRDDFDKFKETIGDSDIVKDEDLRVYLISFFKQVAKDNIHDFKSIYELYLTDDERQTLTDTLIE
ncbi:karyopherin KAP114 [Cyberlindnera jadinii NRRL Y-1542]|uniref:ARM repeat-containing protein n=1 Tax=Cyberlindnera jadinii (strain ATCC 18201 / CBS 1600 / BCRC 20928 / JCM 3617 / NBRC 0987 / NRRL Y-1542) TaxID=983966 RepID=A0A1E4S2C6_CYBJN|nr:ARM repeat-containing protein [Cyberlindnera jadinii NRRL Y-1542]ODV73684.1 ARM repeat-containing protein [Cyberlindnera jadinii NRRL Y-1542]